LILFAATSIARRPTSSRDLWRRSSLMPVNLRFWNLRSWYIKWARETADAKKIFDAVLHSRQWTFVFGIFVLGISNELLLGGWCEKISNSAFWAAFCWRVGFESTVPNRSNGWFAVRAV
jgi:hypothetical protein